MLFQKHGLNINVNFRGQGPLSTAGVPNFRIIMTQRAGDALVIDESIAE